MAMENSNLEALKALFEHSSVGILIADKKGRIQDVNPYLCSIFGYTAGELIGEKVEILIPQKIRKEHIGYRESYIKDPRPRSMGVGRELAAVRKSGEEFPVEVSLSSFTNSGELKVVSFVNDITQRVLYKEELERKVKERTKELSSALLELSFSNENLVKEMETRKQAEEQAKAALNREKELSELKTRFVSMASHEFRTPLAGIMTSVSILQKYLEGEGNEKKHRHLDRIKELVRNLTAVLNDFLSLDKLEQGRIGVNITKFDIVEKIKKEANTLKEMYNQSRELNISSNVNELEVELDEDFIRNIVINLLTNAFKYSGETEPVSINIDYDQVIRVSFIDNGCGIPQEEQKYIFDKFFRANNVSTISGTGLGLNIVKRYVTMMGGEVHFESSSAGTTFIVELPLKV